MSVQVFRFFGEPKGCILMVCSYRRDSSMSHREENDSLIPEAGSPHAGDVSSLLSRQLIDFLQTMNDELDSQVMTEVPLAN